MELTRSEALKMGLKKYVSRNPCVNGHNSERYAQNGQCIECKKLVRLGQRKPCPPGFMSEIAKKSHLRKRIEGYADWKSGSCVFSSRTIKRMLADIEGYKCSSCGISDWMGKRITLELEHKDGNSDNNSPDNVCLICPNCHSQTPTYKGANKGRGRHFRRQRYAEGKSY